MSGMPAFSAAGQSQSAEPSVRKCRLCSLWNVKRMPSMPGCAFQSGTSALLAGSARLRRPMTANLSGCERAGASPTTSCGWHNLAARRPLLAARHIDGDARDEVGVARREEADHARLILRFGDTAQRHALDLGLLLDRRHAVPARP